MGNSIATRTGDDGTTSLLFNRRVPKTDLRIEANGAIDELNARLGMAKALLPAENTDPRIWIASVQKQLIILMGEIALASEDFGRYSVSGMTHPLSDFLSQLDARLASLESSGVHFTGWATPGANPGAAAMDLARVAARSAERALIRSKDAGLLNPEKESLILQFFNRLSDVLWLQARALENDPHGHPASAPR